MTDPNEERLGLMFVHWVTDLPQEDVVRRYRELPLEERVDIEGYAFEKSATALNSEEPYGDRFEILARCFDIFADAEDRPTSPSSVALLRRRAHALRHPEEWRHKQSAAAERNQMSERRLRAMALASSCWTYEPLDVRLRRVEEVLPQLNQLADQARTEGNRREHSAIGQDIADLWKLRDALKRRL